MKKQINYSKLIPRLFASTLDLLMLPLIVSPIISVIARFMYTTIFKDFLIEQKVDLSDYAASMSIFYTAEFMEYITDNHKVLTYITCAGSLALLNIIFMAVFFIGFWKYKGATPGKMIMHMKIVDAKTLEKPTTYQLIKRFICYVTAFFGIWSILFTDQKQAFHDKIAGTVVIKV